jgi:hypothetical protein
MPSKSPAQRRLMAAVAHGWKPPASSGIHVPKNVAIEFNRADAGKLPSLTAPGGLVQHGGYLEKKHG